MTSSPVRPKKSLLFVSPVSVSLNFEPFRASRPPQFSQARGQRQVHLGQLAQRLLFRLVESVRVDHARE